MRTLLLESKVVYNDPTGEVFREHRAVEATKHQEGAGISSSALSHALPSTNNGAGKETTHKQCSKAQKDRTGHRAPDDDIFLSGRKASIDSEQQVPSIVENLGDFNSAAEFPSSVDYIPLEEAGSDKRKKEDDEDTPQPEHRRLKLVPKPLFPDSQCGLDSRKVTARSKGVKRLRSVGKAGIGLNRAHETSGPRFSATERSSKSLDVPPMSVASS